MSGAAGTPAQATAPGRLKGQSRSASLLEAVTNVVLGFVLTFVVQGIVYPLLGIVTTAEINLLIATVFTLMSVARSYLVRRAFETFGDC